MWYFIKKMEPFFDTCRIWELARPFYELALRGNVRGTLWALGRALEALETVLLLSKRSSRVEEVRCAAVRTHSQPSFARRRALISTSLRNSSTRVFSPE